jgi:hypothetical protein
MDNNFTIGFEKTAKVIVVDSIENADPRNLKWHEKHRPALGIAAGLLGGAGLGEYLSRAKGHHRMTGVALGGLGALAGLAGGIKSLSKDKQIARHLAAEKEDSKYRYLMDKGMK